MYLALKKCKNDRKILKITLVQNFVHQNLKLLHLLSDFVLISLEQKEIFKNSKRHFSSHAGYLFMFKNGFGRKDAIFIIVAL